MRGWRISAGSFERAREIYKRLGANLLAEPKLQAYALCDYGEILRVFQQLQQAIQYLEKSLTLVPIDTKLVLSFSHLSDASARLKKAEDALRYSERMRDHCIQSGDKYGLALALDRLYAFHAGRGHLKEARSYRDQLEQCLQSLSPTPMFLKMTFLGGTGMARSWNGRLRETEIGLREAYEIAQRLEVTNIIHLTRDLGYVLGMQNCFDEAQMFFTHSLSATEGITASIADVYRSIGLIFKGVVLTRQGHIQEARTDLLDALEMMEAIEDSYWIADISSWLGNLIEVKSAKSNEQLVVAELVTAVTHYQRCVDAARSLFFDYQEGAALTGLVRIKNAQGDYAAIPALLAEAEQLAQQYEYNDHLASLRLTQGHVAWDDSLPEWGSGFDAALRYYQYAAHLRAALQPLLVRRGALRAFARDAPASDHPTLLGTRRGRAADAHGAARTGGRRAPTTSARRGPTPFRPFPKAYHCWKPSALRANASQEMARRKGQCWSRLTQHSPGSLSCRWRCLVLSTH